MSIFVPDNLRRVEVFATPDGRVAEKAGPIGPGAAKLMTEFPLSSVFGGKDPRKKIEKAWQLGISVPWIRTAERIITDKGSTVPWHLETSDEMEVDDTATDPDVLRVQRLLEQPQGNLSIGRRMTGREMKALTLRHMGLCGVSFWYMDELDGLGIPNALLYIRPDRMFPKEDDNGNLVDWVLDPTPNGGGTLLGLQNVLQFNLQPPDKGHYGIGLVESAMLKASLSIAADSHAMSVLSAGGRIQGMVSPKTGAIDDDNIYDQMVLDARTITEQPDAAKRLQIIRAPVDFHPTTMNMTDAKLLELMERTALDLLALWGMPATQVGLPSPAGLNSGNAEQYAEAMLWQNAIHPRLVSMQEVIQFQFLDPMRPVVDLEFEFEEPSFDDDAPRFDTLTKTLNTALRNRERRELIGLDPFGETVIGASGMPVDDEVWMPATMVLAFTAPEEGEQVAVVGKQAAPEAPEGAASQAGESTDFAPPPGEVKAKIKPNVAGIRKTMTALRSSIDAKITPKMRKDLEGFLSAQGEEVATRIREHADHIKSKPKDSTIWWDARKWDKRLLEAMRPSLLGVGKTVNDTIAEMLPAQKAGPAGAVERTLVRGAARVTKINETTRDAIAGMIATAIDEEDGLLTLADSIGGLGIFDEYRSELIARTELMQAYNAEAVASYGDAGVTQVQAIDGDEDEECAARDGQTFDVDEAEGIEDHPNGTLDWLPLVGE